MLKNEYSYFTTKPSDGYKFFYLNNMLKAVCHIYIIDHLLNLTSEKNIVHFIDVYNMKLTIIKLFHNNA